MDIREQLHSTLSISREDGVWDWIKDTIGGHVRTDGHRANVEAAHFLKECGLFKLVDMTFKSEDRIQSTLKKAIANQKEANRYYDLFKDHKVRVTPEEVEVTYKYGSLTSNSLTAIKNSMPYFKKYLHELSNGMLKYDIVETITTFFKQPKIPLARANKLSTETNDLSKEWYRIYGSKCEECLDFINQYVNIAVKEKHE